MVNSISNVKYVNSTMKKTSIEHNDPKLSSDFPKTEDVKLINNGMEQEFLPNKKAEKMINSMNQFLETTNTELRYLFHDKLDKYYVTLVNANTQEVIREIPPKKLMDMYAEMLEFVGIIVDKKI
ncbi:flagellar protein FlaG [Ureibacillus sp. MALMAid1270]|uniref:flagellar protein FlaG n=1 Tax=Ureibacillus sp. MALMAid1270 TaxID=3411629 RepID=UPI003BA614C1